MQRELKKWRELAEMAGPAMLTISGDDLIEILNALRTTVPFIHEIASHPARVPNTKLAEFVERWSE